MRINYDPASLLAKFVHPLGQRLPKPAMFAIIGAIGCLLGALLGEIFAQAPSRHPRGVSNAATELCLLIDCSGSMKGGKLQEVARAASSFVCRLELSSNSIGVVAFSTEAQTLIGLTSSASEVGNALARLWPEGITSMDLGLAAAGTLLQHPMLSRNNQAR